MALEYLKLSDFEKFDNELRAVINKLRAVINTLRLSVLRNVQYVTNLVQIPIIFSYEILLQ